MLMRVVSPGTRVNGSSASPLSATALAVSATRGHCSVDGGVEETLDGGRGGSQRSPLQLCRQLAHNGVARPKQLRIERRSAEALPVDQDLRPIMTSSIARQPTCGTWSDTMSGILATGLTCAASHTAASWDQSITRSDEPITSTRSHAAVSSRMRSVHAWAAVSRLI